MPATTVLAGAVASAAAGANATNKIVRQLMMIGSRFIAIITSIAG
jgi:hypothetical protein